MSGGSSSVVPYNRVVALTDAQGGTVQKELDEVSFALMQLYESNMKTWNELQSARVEVSESLKSQYAYIEGQRNALVACLLNDQSYSEEQWRHAQLQAQSFGTAVQQEFLAAERKFQIVERAHEDTTKRISELGTATDTSLKKTE